jgi:hypothetical protein
MLADNTAPWTPRRTDARTLQWHTTLRRSGTAAADLLAVVLVALLLSPWTSGLWAAIGIVACVYYPVSTALLGRTPASALLVRRKWTVAVAAASALAAQLRIRLLEVMARAPELRACIEQASQSAVLKKAPAVLKNARARLVRLSRWRPQTRRDRELAALRQRRIEAAKRSNDKISEVLG